MQIMIALSARNYAREHYNIGRWHANPALSVYSERQRQPELSLGLPRSRCATLSASVQDSAAEFS